MQRRREEGERWWTRGREFLILWWGAASVNGCSCDGNSLKRASILSVSSVNQTLDISREASELVVRDFTLKTHSPARLLWFFFFFFAWIFVISAMFLTDRRLFWGQDETIVTEQPSDLRSDFKETDHDRSSIWRGGYVCFSTAVYSVYTNYPVKDVCPALHSDALEHREHGKQEIVEVGDAVVGTLPALSANRTIEQAVAAVPRHSARCGLLFCKVTCGRRVRWRKPYQKKNCFHRVTVSFSQKGRLQSGRGGVHRSRNASST